MMAAGRTLRVGTLVGWLAASGCTTLREIPRAEYAAREERKAVAVDTREGLHYEFDYVRFSSDTLTGFRQRDSDSHFEEFDSLPIPLESVAKVSTRRVDWYRTGLVGGGALAAIVAAALARRGGSSGTPSQPCYPKCFEP
jgi:hypothetical protein